MHGRLGNTLFQYAALFGISKKLGVDFGIPYENGNEFTKLGYYDFFTNEWIHYRFDLADVFEITAKNIHFEYDAKNLYYEKHFAYDNTTLNLNDNTDINGWFQSHKYFEHCENELREEFKFKLKYFEKALEYYISFTTPCCENKCKKTLLIAMRLDDGYMFDKNFATTNKEYYEKAISQFNLDEYDIIITADNLTRAREMLANNDMYSKNISVLNEPCPYTTLAFASLCDDFIIPNSTYHWWCAWFGNNKNKKVIIPEKWFNAKVDFSTMSPKEWIKI